MVLPSSYSSCVAHLSVSSLQMRHDAVLTDPNIQPKWKPYFVEEIREALDFIRNEMRKKDAIND